MNNINMLFAVSLRYRSTAFQFEIDRADAVRSIIAIPIHSRNNLVGAWPVAVRSIIAIPIHSEVPEVRGQVLLFAVSLRYRSTAGEKMKNEK